MFCWISFSTNFSILHFDGESTVFSHFLPAFIRFNIEKIKTKNIKEKRKRKTLYLCTDHSHSFPPNHSPCPFALRSLPLLSDFLHSTEAFLRDSWYLDFGISGSTYMGQQSLIYSFVARGTVILAEYTEFTGNFTSIASQCLQKLPATNNKFTYNCDGHTFNYLVENGFSTSPFYSRSWQFICRPKVRWSRWIWLIRFGRPLCLGYIHHPLAFPEFYLPHDACRLLFAMLLWISSCFWL